MKVIIAGPRDLNVSQQTMLRAVERSGFEVTEVVHGGASGVDMGAAELAFTYMMPEKVFRPRWNTHGRAAGPMRNRKMAEYGDALVVVKRRGKETAGTSSMVREAERKGLPVHVEGV